MSEVKLKEALKSWSKSYVKCLVAVARCTTSDALLPIMSNADDSLDQVGALYESLDVALQPTYEAQVAEHRAQCTELVKLVSDKLAYVAKGAAQLKEETAAKEAALTAAKEAQAQLQAETAAREAAVQAAAQIATQEALKQFQAFAAQAQAAAPPQQQPASAAAPQQQPADAATSQQQTNQPVLHPPPATEKQQTDTHADPSADSSADPSANTAAPPHQQQTSPDVQQHHAADDIAKPPPVVVHPGRNVTASAFVPQGGSTTSASQQYNPYGSATYPYSQQHSNTQQHAQQHAQRQQQTTHHQSQQPTSIPDGYGYSQYPQSSRPTGDGYGQRYPSQHQQQQYPSQPTIQYHDGYQAAAPQPTSIPDGYGYSMGASSYPHPSTSAPQQYQQQSDGFSNHPPGGYGYPHPSSSQPADGYHGPPVQPTQPNPQQQYYMQQNLVDHLKVSRLPVPQPTVFCGDPLEYTSWLASFQALITQSAVPYHEAIYHLQKYLGGRALQCVSDLFMSNDPYRYTTAMDKIRRKFGDKRLIAKAFKTKLYEWTPLPANNLEKLEDYCDFLGNCLEAKASYPTLDILDFSSELTMLAAKLPHQMIQRWNKEVTDRARRYDKDPTFQDLVTFVTKEVDSASSPLIASRDQGPQKHKDKAKGKSKGQGQGQAAQTLATSSNNTKGNSSNSSHRSNNSTNNKQHTNKYSGGSGSSGGSSGSSGGSSGSSGGSGDQEKCEYCGRTHRLKECDRFDAASMSTKQEFLQARRLCFGCLKKGHGSRNCQRRDKCSKCSGRHPTCLHSDDRQPNNKPNPARNNLTAATSDGDAATQDATQPAAATTHNIASNRATAKCTMTVPVYVSSPKQPDVKVFAYALLDTQSDTSFVTEALVRQLKLDSVPTKLCLTTMGSLDQIIDSTKIHNITVQRADCSDGATIQIPAAFTRDSIPYSCNSLPTPKVAQQWKHLKFLQSKLLRPVQTDATLLIGYDVSEALRPIRIVSGAPGQPYAVETNLGWSIVGCTDNVDSQHYIYNCSTTTSVATTSSAATTIPTTTTAIVLRAATTELLTPLQVHNLLEQGFKAEHSDKVLSQDDKQFLAILDEKTVHQDGRYTIPLPFANTCQDLPNNRNLALHRALSLKKRLLSDNTTKVRYCKFMEDLLEAGHAELAPADDLPVPGKSWFLAHHGVYNQSQPDKLRVVFDASAKCSGICLNDVVLGGPDLNNSLTGVLTRFRKEQIAVVCDVKKMFLQFRVPVTQRNYLSFWWWEGNQFDCEPRIYRMTSHVFGAKSSPSCAVYGLQKTADQFSEPGSDVHTCIHQNFYVDDALYSVSSPQKAVDLVQSMEKTLSNASLQLHKYVTNSPEVRKHLSLPTATESLSVPGADSMQRALGVKWCVATDSFQFIIDTPVVAKLSRRNILSVVSSIYDPLGFISPFVLEGRNILQSLCRTGLDWDDPLPEEMAKKYHTWYSSLSGLKKLQIPRCLKPKSFGKVATAQLHTFADASLTGLGVACYVRFVDVKGQVHVSLVAAKSKVIPSKQLTIPRLELVAAVTAAKVGSRVKEELSIDGLETFFWSDSKVVLGYIANTTKRFHIFVANRVELIRERTDVQQWFHVDTKSNPADLASRGIEVSATHSYDLWFRGPSFLWQPTLNLPDDTPEIPKDDPEVKASILATQTDVKPSSLDISHLQHCHSWLKLLRAVALCTKFQQLLLAKVNKTAKPSIVLQTADLDQSRVDVVRAIQAQFFAPELHQLQQSKPVAATSSLRKLDVFLDSFGVLRVGGRLTHSSLGYDSKHPMLFPSVGKCSISRLLVQHYHQSVQHQGRHYTTTALRNNGFWLVNCSSSVRSVLNDCYLCKRLYSPTQTQKMSDLPPDRVNEASVFSHVGVDIFGPFQIYHGRRSAKRYAALFTCLASRAIHLEVVHSLSTDSFLSALRRLEALRGPVKFLRSDRGTNFIGAKAELCTDAIQRFLQSHGGDVVEWKLNVPKASHFGGVWERQIRSARRILAAILQQSGSQLSDESLQTIMYEVAAIVNSRPLSAESLDDCTAPTAISPGNLLTGKSCITLLPPGEFHEADLFCRKHWRRVQFLLNTFWNRWRTEYLQTLQSRQKWLSPSQNIKVGDIVLIKDDLLPRNQWSLAKVIETKVSDDKAVRSVKLVVGTASLSKTGKRTTKLTTLERPIHKLVILVKAE